MWFFSTGTGTWHGKFQLIHTDPIHFFPQFNACRVVLCVLSFWFLIMCIFQGWITAFTLSHTQISNCIHDIRLELNWRVVTSLLPWLLLWLLVLSAIVVGVMLSLGVPSRSLFHFSNFNIAFMFLLNFDFESRRLSSPSFHQCFFRHRCRYFVFSSSPYDHIDHHVSEHHAMQWKWKLLRRFTHDRRVNKEVYLLHLMCYYWLLEYDL